jgi:5'-nucleotidase
MHQGTILLTNDDGIHAPGLWALYEALRNDFDVTVIAPDRERSAVGHAITLHHPLRAGRVSLNGYHGWAVSGTPADCIKLALGELMAERPAMVISGINPGANVGIDLNYSGTVAAAKEATIYGLHAVAISIQARQEPHFETAARFAATLVPMVLEEGLPSGTFLNVNVPNLPPSEVLGVWISRQSLAAYDDCFEKRQDPRNRTYYWQRSESVPKEKHPDSDDAVLNKKYISITPVRCDMTDYDNMETLRRWKFSNDELTGRRG